MKWKDSFIIKKIEKEATILLKQRMGLSTWTYMNDWIDIRIWDGRFLEFKNHPSKHFPSCIIGDIVVNGYVINISVSMFKKGIKVKLSGNEVERFIYC